jgi:hypothetical protein
VVDVFFFAKLSQRPFRKDVVGSPRNASVGSAVADQHGGESSAGIDGA